MNQDADRRTVVIAGGSGFLGQALARDLTARGCAVVVLTRRIRADLPWRQVVWDGRTVGDWASELNGECVSVVNLAGRLVDARPTAANIADLRESRVLATEALVEASHRASRPVHSWLQASTTAIWSDGGETRLMESSPVPAIPPGLPQMTGVAVPWEAAVEGVAAKQLTILRTSIVLAAGCPAYDRLMMLARNFIGGTVGNGQQWICWIHLDDWLRLARASLGLEPGLTLPGGVLVAATDHPVRNAELMAALRRHAHRPSWAPTMPAWLLRIGAVALRTDPALALTGRHATSEVLAGAGFTFAYPTIDEALAAIS